MADERVHDGIREIREEVGIHVPFNDLEKLGIIEYSITKEDFIDNEIAHVFLYKCEHNLNDFFVQQDEVSGIVLAEFKDFSELWSGKRETIKVSGFKIDTEGNRHKYYDDVGKDKFVPHQISFYKEVIKKIKERI